MAKFEIILNPDDQVADVVSYVRDCCGWWWKKRGLEIGYTPWSRTLVVSREPPFTDDEAQKIAEKFNKKYGRVLEVIP